MLNEIVYEISQKQIYKQRRRTLGYGQEKEDAQKMKENFCNYFDLFYSEYFILF